MHFSGSTILSNILLVQNLVGRQDIVGVMWTLTMEVQMYLVLPMLFVFAKRDAKLWTLIVIWALAVATNLAFMPGRGVNLPKVIPNFIPGVIAYVGFRKFKAVLPAWTFAPFLLACMAVFMMWPSPQTSWCIALVFGLLLPKFRQIASLVFVKAFNVIALYSYGIYLWHSFGMHLAFHFLRGPWIQVSGELAFTAVASVVGYHLIEKPMIQAGHSMALKARSLPSPPRHALAGTPAPVVKPT